MWEYKNNELNESMIPAKAVGFLYRITRLADGKWYIGRKLLTKAAIKVVNGKRKRIRKESDWKDYWSSSPDLRASILAEGTEKYHREVLCFAQSKSTLNYMEECALYQLGALEVEDSFNGNIRSKVWRKWINGKDDITMFRQWMNHQSSSSSSTSSTSSSSLNSSSLIGEPQNGQNLMSIASTEVNVKD